MSPRQEPQLLIQPQHLLLHVFRRVKEVMSDCIFVKLANKKSLQDFSIG